MTSVATNVVGVHQSLPLTHQTKDAACDAQQVMEAVRHTELKRVVISLSGNPLIKPGKKFKQTKYKL